MAMNISRPAVAHASGSRYSPGRIVRGVWTRTRTYAEGVGSLLPKLIYGNNAGFSNNYGPARELSRLRRASALPATTLRAEPYATHARSLRSNGYVVFRSKGDPERLARLRASVQRVMVDPEVSVASPNGATRHLLDPIENVPELGELLTDELCRSIEAYYGCPMRIQSIRVWRNHHVPNADENRQDVFSNTFHHDTTPVTGLRVFVLLCDGVTRETGAFRFHDKATSMGIIRSLGYFHRDKMPASTRRKLLDPATLKFFEGNTGDTCICNTQECLHAASVPREGSFRDILQFEVMPSAEAASRAALLANVPPDEQVSRHKKS